MAERLGLTYEAAGNIAISDDRLELVISAEGTGFLVLIFERGTERHVGRVRIDGGRAEVLQRNEARGAVIELAVL